MSDSLALIVEADEALAQQLAWVIRQQGYETETVNSVYAAMKRLGSYTPDLVVVDLELPGAPSDMIVRMFRKDPRFGSSRLIVATSDYQTAAGVTGTLADIVLEKPIDLKHLSLLVTRFNK